MRLEPLAITVLYLVSTDFLGERARLMSVVAAQRGAEETPVSALRQCDWSAGVLAVDVDVRANVQQSCQAMLVFY